MPLVQTLGLWLARMSISAWVGAAVLFVIVGVSEVSTPAFDSTVRDQLVLLRFPWYYTTGFTLVTVSALGTATAFRHPQLSRRMGLATLTLLVLAMVGMLVDYLQIYLPLRDMIDPPGNPRTERFTELHHWSARLNGVNLIVCTLAAGILSWPRRSSGSEIGR